MNITMFQDPSLKKFGVNLKVKEKQVEVRKFTGKKGYNGLLFLRTQVSL